MNVIPISHDTFTLTGKERKTETDRETQRQRVKERDTERQGDR